MEEKLEFRIEDNVLLERIQKELDEECRRLDEAIKTMQERMERVVKLTNAVERLTVSKNAG